MRLSASLIVVLAVGCSSSNFEVADPSAEVGADSGVVVDSAIDDTNSPPTDTDLPPPVDAGGPSCTTIDDCRVGEYCRRTTCEITSGTCAPYTVTTAYAPVCGCDGVTYWNKSYAFTTDGVIKYAGRCNAMDAKACLGSACETPDSLCVHEIPNSTGCITTTDAGVCFRLPPDHSCGTTPGGSVATCDGKCLTYCSAVRNKVHFYQKACTPL